MALRDTLEGVLDKARGIFQRDKEPRDAFGSDDENYDEESVEDPSDDAFSDDEDDTRKSALVTKIAYGVSGLMLLGLIGIVGAIFLTGDETAQPTTGSLAGLQLEEEPTEGTVERRPWLTPTQGTPRRLGVNEETKPADPKAATPATANRPTPPPAREADVKAPTPTPAPAAPTTPTVAADAAKPAATPTAPTDPKVAPTQVAATPSAPPQTAAAPSPSQALPTPMPEPDAEPAEEEQKVAGMPSLMAPAPTAPGAPRRMETEAGSGGTAGGKPQLNDPPLPPVDRASVGAPPPRFAAITNIKFEPPSGKAPKIAVIVEGLGLNKASTEAAMAKLPPTVTLAFSPYARDLKQLIDRAKRKGHEVLIEVPMESKAFPAEDPGPLGLLTSLDAKENADRLETILKEATGVVGVFDGMGSKFRESETHMSDVKTKLKAANLFYVQGRPGIRVGDITLPNATTDVVIDERPFRAAVDARFDYAERMAKFQGSTVAVMTARPISFERLALWVEQLPKKGVTLAPVSQVLVQ